MTSYRLAGRRPRIAVCNAPRHYIGSRFGLGYHVPLGLVAIAGPMVDAGYVVKFIDADAMNMAEGAVVRRVAAFGADVLMIGHTGSTGAHPVVESLCRSVKRELPNLTIVYGGVFPTFAHRAIMRQVPEVDVIVRGEGEETVVDLMEALLSGYSLADVDGITWRDGDRVVINRSRRPIHDLDRHRMAWELVDWDLYRLFNIKRAATVQFGRGCPNRCGYCGQWAFWRTYRHRSVKNFVDDLQLLKEEYGVKAIFPADEHFAADRETTEELLNELISRDLGLPLYINTTVKDVIRDADLLPTYREAGIVFAALGVESDSPKVQELINKNNRFEESCEAVRLLRRHDILPLVQMIYGIEDETVGTLWRKLRSIVKMDPDFANLEYITPHFWTPMGRHVDPRRIIQLDQGKWGYRNQVLRVPSISEKALFFGVKLTELAVHVRPKVVLRALLQRRKYLQSFRIYGLLGAFRVWFMEIVEFIRDTSFARPDEVLADSRFLERVLNFSADPSSLPALGPGPVRLPGFTERCPVTRTAKRLALRRAG